MGGVFEFETKEKETVDLLNFSHNIEAESKEKHGVWDPMPELTK